MEPAPPVGGAGSVVPCGRSETTCRRGIRVLQHLADLADGRVLEVEHHGGRACGIDVGAVLGIADDRDGFVPGLREESFEDEGDLAVTSGDDDAHGSQSTRDRLGSQGSPRLDLRRRVG